MVQNARNLMTVVLKAMTAAEAVCVKVGIYQFIIYVCPLTSSIPIISPTTEHTKCIPLSTTIKHTNYTTTIKHIFYMGYKWTYQQYPPSLSIPIISASIEHTNDIHNHWLNQLYHYPLPLNLPIYSLPSNTPTTIKHTKYNRGEGVKYRKVRCSHVYCYVLKKQSILDNILALLKQ